MQSVTKQFSLGAGRQGFPHFNNADSPFGTRHTLESSLFIVGSIYKPQTTVYLGNQCSSIGQKSYLIQSILPPGSTPMPFPAPLPPPTGTYSPTSKGPHDIFAAVNKVLLAFLKEKVTSFHCRGSQKFVLMEKACSELVTPIWKHPFIEQNFWKYYTKPCVCPWEDPFSKENAASTHR